MKGIWAIPIIVSILLVGTLDDAYAATCVSQSSGDWNDNIWKDGEDACTPGVSDDKIIISGHVVTMSSAITNDGRISIFGGTLIVASTFTNNGFNDGGTFAGVTSSAGNVIVTSTGIFQNNGLFDNLFGTLTINSGGQFFNNYASGNGHFHNEHVGATVTVNGELTNTGDIHQLNNGNMIIGSTGKLTNTGANALFDNRAGATITNTGMINNFSGGTILIDGGTINNNSGGIINNSGTIAHNSGTINNNGGIIINNGTIINTATINNTGGTMTNNGTITNNAFINNNSGGIINNTGGTMTNNGTITNLFTGTINNSGSITNSGTINNSGTIVQCGVYTGVLPTGSGLTPCTLSPDEVGQSICLNVLEGISWDEITFTCTVANYTIPSVQNLLIDSGVRLEVTGTLENLGTIGLVPTSILTNTGTIDNSGTINNFGTIDNSGVINNSGDIINCGTYTGTLPTINGLQPCSLPALCAPPPSIDWTVSSTCTMTDDATADGNVIVPSGVVLTIPNGVELNIDFATKNLTIQFGGGVLIESGGTITSLIDN